MHLPISILARTNPLNLGRAARGLYRQLKSARRRRTFTHGLLCGVLSLMFCMALTGCGSGSGSSLGARAGAILIANATTGAKGNISALSAATTAQLSMMPSGDSLNAGVDWTVTCGGNPVTGSVVNGACGTFTPTHTADGAATLFTAPATVPIGTTVTINASVTSNPSQSTTINLTIVAVPITISFLAQEQPPASLLTSQQVALGSVQSNAPASAGAVWSASCGATACGSFNLPIGAGTKYTAPPVVPPGGNVTVTVTSLVDTTKSASATISILAAPPPPPPPPPISVSVTPVSLFVQTGRTGRFTATLANDAALGKVNWTTSCGSTSCGSITAQTSSGAAATFAAPTAVPTGGTVTITATSQTDPTKVATAVVTILTTAPIAVTLSTTPSLPATLAVGSHATLAATVASDPNNLGVDWTASCGSAGACGSFNLTPAHTASGGQIVYTAPSAIPAGNVVTITASSSSTTTPENPASATTTIVAPPVVAFLQSPPATLSGTAQAPVSATVANDVAPGGITWTVQCSSTVPGGCGWIAPVQTASGATALYTAPPVTTTGTMVTLVATSTAAPQASASSAITINPSTTLTTNFVPSAPSEVQANSTVNLSAAVTNDFTNAGVDWQVCASGCGFFTTQPAIAAVPATQSTPYVPAVPAVTSTHVTAWPNNAALPYTAPLQVPSSGNVVVLVASHADPTAANSATIAIGSNSNGPALYGRVLAGTTPVAGAAVALYAAGTTGYSSLAGQVYAPGGTATTPTDSNGNFTVSGGYSCPSPGSQMYLVATGGSVGANAPNPNLALMTALGSCDTLSSSPVVVNEITSVASAYATAPFASNQPLTGLSSYAYLGASSSNSVGLANAFATVNNLVDISTGQVRFIVPSGNAAVPYAQINTLADILNSCTATTGGVYGDGSPCAALFSATAVLGVGTTYGQNSVAPTDTLQALFNIVEHPVTAYGYLLSPAGVFGLLPSSAPFQPTLTGTAPNDWSLSLNYTGGGGLSKTASVAGSFAIDAAGDLWITDTKNGTAIEWNPVGAALSPVAGFPAGGGPIAIDGLGDIWISGNGALTELTSLGTPMPGSPFGGVPGGGSDMAIDAQNNLWIAAGGGVAEFDDFANVLSPSTGYTNSGIAGIASVGIDSSNNVWAGYSATSHANFAELSNPGGGLFYTSAGVGAVASTQIAADGAGDMWAVVPAGYMCKIPQYPGKGQLDPSSTCTAGGGNQGNSSTNLNFNFANPAGIALDGAGTVWFATSGGPLQGSTFPPSLLPDNPGAASSYTPPNLVSPSLAAGTLRVAIDGSGNVWVLLADNTVTEYVGAAVPVVTPVAVGVQKKKLAAKP